MKKDRTEDRIDRVADVETLTGLKRTTLWRLTKADPPQFPLPIRLSDRAIGWRHSEVLEWLASRPPVEGGAR